MKEKRSAAFKALSIASAVCFIIALALIVLLRVLQIDRVSEWYSKYTGTLMSFEQHIENMDNRWLAVLVIELNFLVKAIVPWIPISCICVVSGVIFKWYIALFINVSGLIMLFTIRYYWGKHLGGGNAQKLLSKYEKAYAFVDNEKIGGPLVLFGFRLMPCLPINSISQIYGSMGYDYWKYILISLVGFAYKLFSYTIIGRNVYDPLSAKFIVPLIPLFLISSVVLLILNGAINVTVTARNRIKLSKAGKNGRSKDMTENNGDMTAPDKNNENNNEK